jgi:hypothetical protein
MQAYPSYLAAFVPADLHTPKRASYRLYHEGGLPSAGAG